jgi:uncharacterized membrane protein YphA (DoxX/SURF4 family)
MTDVLAVAVLAIMITAVFAVHLFRHYRKPPPEFDGGFRHNHPRVTTTIYSKHINEKDD